MLDFTFDFLPLHDPDLDFFSTCHIYSTFLLTKWSNISYQHLFYLKWIALCRNNLHSDLYSVPSVSYSYIFVYIVKSLKDKHKRGLLGCFIMLGRIAAEFNGFLWKIEFVEVSTKHCNQALEVMCLLSTYSSETSSFVAALFINNCLFTQEYLIRNKIQSSTMRKYFFMTGFLNVVMQLLFAIRSCFSCLVGVCL